MADQKSTAPADYDVTRPREIGGIHRSVGETVTMMPAQAKYYLPPYDTGLNAAVTRAAKRKADADKPAAGGGQSED